MADSHRRHTRFKKLPDADIFVHAGDFTRHGEGAEEFALWFHALPYKLKLLTLGNHERKDSAYPIPVQHWESLFGPMLLLDRGIRAGVNDTSITIVGIPDATQLQALPQPLDVVVSHYPPYKILDATQSGGHAGNEHVGGLVEACAPALHIFGHVHAQGGETYRSGKTLYVNAATCAVLIELSEDVQVVGRYSAAT